MAHSTTIAETGDTRYFRMYGWLGLLIMALSEVFLILDSTTVKQWFTPIMWSGYILFADALLYRIKGHSLIMNRSGQFLFMLPFSVVCWVIFEVYNLHLQNWRYEGLPENTFLRYLGYIWAFATIWPGVLLTYDIVHTADLFKKIRLPTFHFNRWALYLICAFGLSMLIVPVLVSQHVAAYLFGPVWIGFVLFLDPINYFMGAPSLFGDLAKGKIDKLLALFVAGAICGFLWEFWNYWATAKWIYALPFLNEPKIFEMPVVGFFGFLPFAVEIYVMWEFVAKILKMRPTFGE